MQDTPRLTHIKSNRHPRGSGDLHLFDRLFYVIPDLIWNLLVAATLDVNVCLIWDLIMSSIVFRIRIPKLKP